jgi:hypothetical protein
MKRHVLNVCALLVLGAITIDARASSVLINENQLVMSGAPLPAVPLTISGPGELTVTLTDENFPAFSSLQFFLGNATTPLTSLSDAGTQVLDLTAPTTLYVDIFATPNGGSGLFNLTADFNATSAVPLPDSGSCLASAVLLLILWQSRRGFGRNHVTVMTSVA